jgi:hypothetical protein
MADINLCYDLLNTDLENTNKNRLEDRFKNKLEEMGIKVLNYSSSFDCEEYDDSGFWLYNREKSQLWYTDDFVTIIKPDLEYAEDVAEDNSLKLDYNHQPDTLTII